MTIGEVRAMTTKEISIGVAGSLIASVLWLLMCLIINKIKNRKKKMLYKRIKEANVKSFFYDRDVLNSDSGSVGSYINGATKEVYLIGSWLTSSIKSEHSDFKETVLKKIESGVEFYFCFNNLNISVIRNYAMFINAKEKDVIESLYDTYKYLFEIKRALQAESKNKIHIYSHNQVLTTAFWALDISVERRSFYKIDHKVIKGEISHSYGFEFGDSKKGSFSKNITDGYMYVLNNSKELGDLKELLNESEEINDSEGHKIILDSFK